MIESIKCIKNVGPFKEIGPVELGKTTLIFAENGRGKTMLSEVFRSLATDRPELVAGRKRLGAGEDPLVVLEQSGSGRNLRWDPNSREWTPGKSKGSRPKIAVFNDVFVDANVYSGLEVEAGHLQGLHSVAVGEEGVEKAQSYTQAGADVNKARKTRDRIERSIREWIGAEFKVDDFVNWNACSDIDKRIAESQEAIKLPSNAARLRKRPKLKPLPMPDIDIERIRSVLSHDISDLSSDASRMVGEHLAALWSGAESWLHEGWTKQHERRQITSSNDICPYCGQDLANSQLVDLFKHYFDAAYQDAKKKISGELRDFESANDNSRIRNLRAAVEANSRLLEEWELDGLKLTQRTEFDAEAAIATWQEVAALIITGLKKKVNAPLDEAEFDQPLRNASDRFRGCLTAIASENSDIDSVNAEIERMVAQSKGQDLIKLEREARRLQCLKLRGDTEIEESCTNYKAAQIALKCAEDRRDVRRSEMWEHNSRSFQRYGNAINSHLANFNVGFRISELKGTAPGGVVTSEFVIAINGEDVKLKNSEESASFSNTLSGGDRTALALAFFFASLDQRSDLSETVVVIDDPLSSLDAGRRKDTISAVRRYATEAAQLVLLSHDRGFLCEFIRKAGKRAKVVGFSINYDSDASTIDNWHLEDACRREELARGIRMQRFLDGDEGASLSLFRDIRHHIENYVSLAFPSEFVTSSGVGGFLSNHERDDGLYRESPLLSSERVAKLRDLHEYSSDDLHWNIVPESAETELRSYVRRTLEFCRGQTQTPERALGC